MGKGEETNIEHPTPNIERRIISKTKVRYVLKAEVGIFMRPDRDREREAGRRPLSRLLVSLLFLIAGLVLVFFWISYPALILVFLVCAAILGGFIFCRFKGSR